MRRTIVFRLATSVLIALGVTAVAWGGIAVDFLHGQQLRFVDSIFPSGARDPRVAIVAVDDKSLAAVGRWPWQRTEHARIIDRLRAGGAALIGYDVTFTEPSDEASDRALVEAARRAQNVVVSVQATFPREKASDLPPNAVLRASHLEAPFRSPASGDLGSEAAGIAHVNVIPDLDGVVRAIPPLIESPQGDLVPSLSLALAMAAEELSGPFTIRPEGLDVGGSLIPTGPGHLLDVNFVTGFPTYSAIDVIHGDTPPGAFRDKVVLVGASAVGLGDNKLTPLDKSQGQPGVLVHANALNTLLTRQFLFPDSTAVTLLTVSIWALVVALAVNFLWLWLSPVVVLGLGFLGVMVAFRRFDGGHVMNMVYPTIALVLAYIAAMAVRYLTELRERRRVTQMFGRYLAKDVVEEVLAAPEGAIATLKGASRELTMLFADLRGFTSASERVAPGQVVAALNVYLDAMTRAVVEERGTIDKFMGDCVMAFWGAPKADPGHAARAVRAAMKMQDYIDAAMESNPDAGGLKVKGCGVGIATGEAVVGNIGSAERLDYTVIGDTVNTASRLCGVAGPGEIVITEPTSRAIGDGFRLGPLPPLTVKGKARPLTVFQVLRAGQGPKSFDETETLDATEEKGHFVAPQAKAAGYAPIEPVGESVPEPGP